MFSIDERKKSREGRQAKHKHTYTIMCVIYFTELQFDLHKLTLRWVWCIQRNEEEKKTTTHQWRRYMPMNCHVCNKAQWFSQNWNFFFSCALFWSTLLAAYWFRSSFFYVYQFFVCFEQFRALSIELFTSIVFWFLCFVFFNAYDSMREDSCSPVIRLNVINRFGQFGLRTSVMYHVWFNLFNLMLFNLIHFDSIRFDSVWFLLDSTIRCTFMAYPNI